MTEVDPARSVTGGIDHIGLTVADLKASTDFFIECLGWRACGGRPEYPAAYVTDGSATLTLWQVKDRAQFRSHDRRNAVGLHHLAIRVGNRDALDQLFLRVRAWPGVEIEFAPEPSGAGPKIHFMIREPGGCRLELAWDPRVRG